MRLSVADEQLLRWYCHDFSGDQLRSSWSTVVGRATGEIPPSGRTASVDISDKAIEQVRVANRVRNRLKGLSSRLRQVLLAAYVYPRERQLELAYDRLAGVVLLLPSVRGAYRKAQDKPRAAGLSFVRWVIVTTKHDKAVAAAFGDEADRLLSEAVAAWQKTRSRKRPIPAKSWPT